MKRTPWFPIKTLPVRVGVYNVSCLSEDQTGHWYSYFDGVEFGFFINKHDNLTLTDTANEAYSSRNLRTAAKVLSWRGILK